MRRCRLRSVNRGLALTVFAALAAAPRAASGQPVAQGVDFQINTYTAGDQSHPAVALDAEGDFVAVWRTTGQDGQNYGIFAKRFASGGTALGGEFQVNTYTDNDQDDPAVAMEDNGDFVVVWTSTPFQDGSGNGVFARRFASSGVALATEFQVNVYTSGNQREIEVAMDANGDFVVVWDSPGQDDYPNTQLGVFARRYDSAGNPIASEFLVNSYVTSNQYLPDVAMDDAGEFVVVWESFGQDGSQRGIFGQRFDAAGVALAAEFMANHYTSGFQDEATVAMDGDGGFVVAFESPRDGSTDGIFAQRYDSTGAAIGGEFQVNAYTNGGQIEPQAAMDEDGDFVVAWQSSGYHDGAGFGIFARRFDSNGAPQAGEFQVNTYTQGDQSLVEVDTTTSGDFVMAWESFGQDKSSYGVFSRRYRTLVLVPADADGNAGLAALTDGLLVLRFLFGFTGDTLTAGATGGGCTRCDGTAIANYLTGLGATLDVDGNGSKTALTDGLLFLRWLFGFTGPTLTAGAVGMGCSRCDADAILAYLSTLD